jgi:hypothetical protein
MLRWREKNGAYTAPVELGAGQREKVVLVGPRTHPMGAVIIVAPEDGGPVQKIPLDDALDDLTSAQLVEIMCMQERVFGEAARSQSDASE